MVINYKRLNDNTFDDAYKIPNKDSLINSIQECRYFSQLDCMLIYYYLKTFGIKIQSTKALSYPV